MKPEDGEEVEMRERGDESERTRCWKREHYGPQGPGPRRRSLRAGHKVLHIASFAFFLVVFLHVPKQEALLDLSMAAQPLLREWGENVDDAV